MAYNLSKHVAFVVVSEGTDAGAAVWRERLALARTARRNTTIGCRASTAWRWTVRPILLDQS